jgi:hypothetical protein
MYVPLGSIFLGESSRIEAQLPTQLSALEIPLGNKLVLTGGLL